MKKFWKSFAKKTFEKNIVWNIRCLANESFVPSTQQPSILCWRLSGFTYNKCIAISAKSFYNFLFFPFFPISTPLLCWLLQKYKLSRKNSLIFSPGILLPMFFWLTERKKMFKWQRTIFESQGCRLRICKLFEITRTISFYLNS